MIRLQITRKVHVIASRSTENKLKKIKTFINNYEHDESELKSKGEYLTLLSNIYHTIPSRLNEHNVWHNFLIKLKAEKCYEKLKTIIRKNTISNDSLICKQVIFLYYIGFDIEMNHLLNKLHRKLRKCSEENFRECDKYLNENINDVIKMLYVLYYTERIEREYKDVFYLFDKYIYYSKKYPINNLKYLLYFHLFYLNMNHSLIKISECIEMYRHLLATEQLMVLIRYINIYLKQLYLHNLIKHRNDTSVEDRPPVAGDQRSEEVLEEGVVHEKNVEAGASKACALEKRYGGGGCDGGGGGGWDGGGDGEGMRKRKIQREIGILISNMFRLNKNEKEYFIFHSFDDIEIKKKESVEKSAHMKEENPVFIIPKGNDKDRRRVNAACEKVPLSHWNEKIDYISTIGEENIPVQIGIIDRKVDNIQDDNQSKGYYFGHNPVKSEKIQKRKIGVNINELSIYKNIYNLCVKEVLKNILLYKNNINSEIIWNHFKSNMFKDKYIYLLMYEMNNQMDIMNEENFLIYLKQVKLLKLYENSSFLTICSKFFKNYIIRKKYINNLRLADKLTYYTDIFCNNSFLQKYILYIYTVNVKFFNIKILKKIVLKLFFFLQQNKSLVNGFDKFIKTAIIKIIMNGSLNDIVTILYTLRQYTFYTSKCRDKIVQGIRELNSHDYDVIVNSIGHCNQEGINNTNDFIYYEIKKKVRHILQSPCKNNTHSYNSQSMQVISENVANPIRNSVSPPVESYNLFHLSNIQLGWLMSDYLKIYEYLYYRTIIEKNEVGTIVYDKYYDANMAIMISKQLTKLFCIFLKDFLDSILKGDYHLNIFQCINNFFSDRAEYYTWGGSGHSGDSRTYLANQGEVRDLPLTFPILQREVYGPVVRSYAQRHPVEYRLVRDFANLLLMIVMDNFLYFEMNNFYFLNFFFWVFQNEPLPIGIYNYFFFYHIFQKLQYGQISQRERREYIFSEEYFEKKKRKILSTCMYEIKYSIRKCINRSVCGEAVDLYNQEVDDPPCHFGENREKFTEDCEQKGTKDTHRSDGIREERGTTSGLDCIINLILYHFSNAEIVDIFQSCFLLPINNYLKGRKKGVVIKYVSSAFSPNGEHDTCMPIGLNCNNFDEIRGFLYPSGGAHRDDTRGENCQETNHHSDLMDMYEFYYVHMIFRNYLQSNRFKDERDYACCANFFAKRGNLEGEEILKMCTMMTKHDMKSDFFELLVDNIRFTFSTNKSFKFLVSYLFFIMLFMRRNYLNEVYAIFSEMNKHILLNNSVHPMCNFLFNVKKKRQKEENHLTIHVKKTWKYDIIYHLKRKNIFFINNVQLKDSPFIFDIYIPSMNLLFIDYTKCLHYDIFVQHLQANIFDHINAKIMQLDEKAYSLFAKMST
ncbi:conserved Plasmodium protein, unknown function [Plasmodium ovale curtisi]|uniref:Uncharacterized protein n=1 Tax=Plasmodium ovale curtisi TaxID=864141 RepID=A0A1A8VRL5_PLAOA|nr:conserved Plasmodium protein, unknown function [Plasmodium ovale curtisi]SBS89744.1 conserved Plasmodium protein, unknown function [Plasmodium ovale curtisi]